MNTSDIQRDPSSDPILFEIESRILQCDHVAKSQGFGLNDSQIRSVLIKARKSAGGSSPQINDLSVRDRILADLHTSIAELGEELVRQRGGISAQYWILCLQTIEGSIRLRSTGPGSRAYLTFLEGYLPQGGA